MSEESSGWVFIFMGTLMLIYLLGALMIGQLGFAVFLGSVTARIAHMSSRAAIILWTGIYVLATAMVLGIGIYTEASK